METNVLNYRVIIEPEEYPDGSKVYNAFCPTLGVADYGDSVDKVLKSIKDGILLAVECLVKDKEEVPIDNLEEQIVTSAKVKLSSKIKHAFA